MPKTTKSVNRKSKELKLTATSFEALPDVEKNRILAEIEAQPPEERLAESRPLNAKERAQWKAFRANALKRRIGRPKIGNGSKVVSLSVEAGLLKQADAYAKRHGLGRSELFIAGLRELIGAGK